LPYVIVVGLGLGLLCIKRGVDDPKGREVDVDVKVHVLLEDPEDPAAEEEVLRMKAVEMLVAVVETFEIDVEGRREGKCRGLVDMG
jgi:hypothetical protein